MKKLDINYKNRRNALLDLVRTDYPNVTGPIILFSPSDFPGQNFVQDSSFYYFSGIVEAASAIVLTEKYQDFYSPNYTKSRERWVSSPIKITQNHIQFIGFDTLKPMGVSWDLIHIYPYFDIAIYQNMIAFVLESIGRGEKIFTMYTNSSYESFMVRIVIEQLSSVIVSFKENIIDISPQIAQLRRKKDMSEIEIIYKAIDITVQAHYASTSMLKAGNKESQMQAAIEYVFTESGAIPAYPSIVGGGIRGTILHYSQNDHNFIDGDLVVVDAGARYNYYCADITRTYPVSGKFTHEQKELYEIVLQCQELVAEQAKPGMWLFNQDHQDSSLHHIALNFFKQHGYDKYFIHGIGHFLGLDVHDVGDKTKPLQEGDIITIEPGLYIPEKKIGIRIEDNYWIVDHTEPVCLSESLPKTVKAIEEMIQLSFEVDQQ